MPIHQRVRSRSQNSSPGRSLEGRRLTIERYSLSVGSSSGEMIPFFSRKYAVMNGSPRLGTVRSIAPSYKASWRIFTRHRGLSRGPPLASVPPVLEPLMRGDRRQPHSVPPPRKGRTLQLRTAQYRFWTSMGEPEISRATIRTRFPQSGPGHRCVLIGRRSCRSTRASHNLRYNHVRRWGRGRKYGPHSTYRLHPARGAPQLLTYLHRRT